MKLLQILSRNRWNFLIILTTATIAVLVGVLAEHMVKAPQQKTVTVGMILIGGKDEIGWNSAHYRGFAQAAKSLGLHFVYRDRVPEKDSLVKAAAQELVDSGAEVIFGASFDYGRPLLEFAKLHPEVHFYCASSVMTAENVAVYYGRMYQPRYLTGIVAGMMTRTNSIGYVAAMRNSEVVRVLDAFTLGVRSVNPGATVWVTWVDEWNNAAKAVRGAEMLIRSHGVDILTYHQDNSAVSQTAKDHGIFSIGYDEDARSQFGDSYLTAAVWNLEPFYRERMRDCLNRRFEPKFYWDGLDRGSVAISPFSSKVPRSVVARVDSARRMITEEHFDVFYGPIRDNEGRLRVAKGENISDFDLLRNMNWLVDGVREADVKP